MKLAPIEYTAAQVREVRAVWVACKEQEDISKLIPLIEFVHALEAQADNGT